MIDNNNVLLSEEELIKLGFEIVRFKEPNYHVGVDKFYKYDYAFIQINKTSGFRDTISIRFKGDKFILDEFYSVRFYTVGDVENLIYSLTRIKK